MNFLNFYLVFDFQTHPCTNDFWHGIADIEGWVVASAGMIDGDAILGYVHRS